MPAHEKRKPSATRNGYEKVVEILNRAVRRLYRVRISRHPAPVDCAGLVIGKPLQHLMLQPSELLSPEGLQHQAEQGRKPLEVILGLAYQLGVCDGYQLRADEVRQLASIKKLKKLLEE